MISAGAALFVPLILSNIAETFTRLHSSFR